MQWKGKWLRAGAQLMALARKMTLRAVPVPVRAAVTFAQGWMGPLRRWRSRAIGSCTERRREECPMRGQKPNVDRFANWVETLMRERGYLIDGLRGGGRTRLAQDAGVHRAAVTRLLQRRSIPDLDTMRSLAPVLGVSLREMLIVSGRVAEEDLPLVSEPTGDEPAPASGTAQPSHPPRRITPEEAARLLGVPPSHHRQFIEMTEMILKVSGGDSGVSAVADA